MTKIALVTMAYFEEAFLGKWIDHYRTHAPNSTLIPILHGNNTKLESLVRGTKYVTIDRSKPYPEMESHRWRFLSDFCKTLFEQHKFEHVIYTDVDEYLFCTISSLEDEISKTKSICCCPMGMEIIHQERSEKPIDFQRPIFQQRRYYRRTTFHSKPCILRGPVNWARGGHFSDTSSVSISNAIYCVHLRFVDKETSFRNSEYARENTAAPKGLNDLPYRKWRRSSSDMHELWLSFENLAVVQKGRLPTTKWYEENIIGELKESNSENGRFFRFNRTFDDFLSTIPERFSFF